LPTSMMGPVWRSLLTHPRMSHLRPGTHHTLCTRRARLRGTVKEGADCGVRGSRCSLRRGPCGCPRGEKVDHCVPQPPLLAVDVWILLLGSIEIINLLVAFHVRRIAGQVTCEGNSCLSERGAQLVLQRRQAHEQDERTSNRNSEMMKKCEATREGARNLVQG